MKAVQAAEEEEALEKGWEPAAPAPPAGGGGLALLLPATALRKPGAQPDMRMSSMPLSRQRKPEASSRGLREGAQEPAGAAEEEEEGEAAEAGAAKEAWEERPERC